MSEAVPGPVPVMEDESALSASQAPRPAGLERLEPPRALVLAAAVFAGARVIGSRVRGVVLAAVILGVGWHYVSWDGKLLRKEVAGLAEREEQTRRPLMGALALDPMESVAELARPLLAPREATAEAARAETLKAELIRMRESLEQARADARRLREDITREHERREAMLRGIEKASVAKAELQQELARAPLATAARPTEPDVPQQPRQLAVVVAPVPELAAAHAVPSVTATEPANPAADAPSVEAPQQLAAAVMPPPEPPAMRASALTSAPANQVGAAAAALPASQEAQLAVQADEVAHVETVAEDAEAASLQLPVSITRRRPESGDDTAGGVPSSVKRHLTVFQPAQL